MMQEYLTNEMRNPNTDASWQDFNLETPSKEGALGEV